MVQTFGLPRRYHDEGVRRYGFHGLSYEYIASRLPEVAPAIADRRVVVAHLGNGASLCAIAEGRSVASTMGFTAVDGLMMGTRCGAIDPGVLIYLMDTEGMDARGLEDLIYRKSGLLGVSGGDLVRHAHASRIGCRPRRRRQSRCSSTASCARSARSPPPWAGSTASSSPRVSARTTPPRGWRSCAAARWLGVVPDDAPQRHRQGPHQRRRLAHRRVGHPDG